MNITEFLLARIAEDEVIATLRGWHAEDCGWLPDESGYSYPCNCGVPERMAAECAAKRAIVDLWELHRSNRDARRSPSARAAEDERAAQDRLRAEARARVAEDAMRALAAVYKDHPDYQEAWAVGG